MGSDGFCTAEMLFHSGYLDDAGVFSFILWRLLSFFIETRNFYAWNLREVSGVETAELILPAIDGSVGSCCFCVDIDKQGTVVFSLL